MEGGDPRRWKDDEGDAESGRHFEGSDVLGGGTIQEILHRLCEGDPLHIQERVIAAARRDGWYLDVHRLTLRAMARTAYSAPLYHGDPPLASWLEERVTEAVRDMLNEQLEEELRRTPISRSFDRKYYESMAEQLDTEPLLARLVCCELNQAPRDARRAFHAMHLEGKSFNRYIAEGNGPPERIKGLLIQTGDRILRALQQHFPDQDFPGRWDDV